MKSNERRRKIEEILDINGSVEVSELSQLLKVSMETIRRDLDILCATGEIKKIHGGAIKSNMSSTDYFFKKRITDNILEKKQLAKTAASFIEDGDIIALDTGTTVLQLVDYIYNKDIFIVTNSLPVITALSQYNLNHLKGKIIFLGGEFNENSMASYGELCISMLKTLNITKAFISCDGFDVAKGLSYHNMREALLTKEYINKSTKTYLLMDSSKLTTNSFYNIGETSMVDTIITSKPYPKELKEAAPDTKWIHVK